MTSSYWQERSRLNKLRVLHLGERLIDELKKVLKGNLDDIDKEIKAFYDKYGDNPAEKLSYDEFQKYKANLIKKAKKYPKDKILQKQAKQDIPKYKIDRLRQLETEVQIKLASATATQETAIKSNLAEVALISNKATVEMFKDGLGLNLGGISERKIKQVIMTDWVGGKNWSERIWDDREKLGQNVKKIMTQGTVRGFGYKKMATTLKDNMSSSFNNAFRLIRTEGAFIQSATTLESYKEAQEELEEKMQYKYDAFLDDRTSSICKELNNKTFWVDDAVVGENFPPMHPNCRSTTQLVLDSDNKKEEKEPTEYKDLKSINNEARGLAEFAQKGKTSNEAVKFAREHYDKATLNSFVNIGQLSNEHVKILGSHTNEIKLSMDSMIKNRINHPDVRYNDYLKINNIINNPDKIILDDKQHIKMFKQIDNKIYETILKTTKDKKENYLVSFHYSNKRRMKK